MRTRRIVLLACLVLVLTATCALAVACNKTEKYTVTWNLDSNVQAVQVTAEGYEYAQEMKDVEKGTVLTFKVTFKQGYEANIVRVGNSTKKASNGVYSFTVDSDVTVSITSKRILNGITATLAQDKVYYAGQTIPASDITVMANYANGDNEAVEDFSIVYAEGNALALGDTSVTITYLTHSDVIEFDDAVEGLVTLNLNGGTLSEEDLATLPENKKVDGDKITWTFTEALAADIALPTPTNLFDPDDDTSAFEFIRWSSANETALKNNDTIKAGLNTSLTVAAIYDYTLVEVTEMKFVNEGGVPYLVIKGEYKAAKQAFLYLFEGNEPPVKYDHREQAVNGADNTFEIKLNLADLTKATPVFAGEGEYKGDNKLPTSFKGMWLDIRLCAAKGDAEDDDDIVMQELFVTDDIDYADLGDQLIAAVEDQYYRFFYESYSPKAGDAITGGHGATFTGEEKILKLHYEETDPYEITEVTLEVKDDKPYVIIRGKALSTKEEAEALLTDYIQILQNFSNWNGVDITGKQTLKVNDDLTFEIALCIENIEDEGLYVMKLSDAEGDNFDPANYDKNAEITIGTRTYSLMEADIHGWGWAWTCIKFEDSSLQRIDYTSVELEIEGEDTEAKLMYVITGSYRNYTKEELEALPLNFDLQGNPYMNSNYATWDGDWVRYTFDSRTIEVNETEGTFVVKIDITSQIIKEYAYTTHFDMSAEQGEATDFKPDIDNFTQKVVFGDYQVAMSFVKNGGDNNFYGCVGITVKAFGTPVLSYEEISLKVEDDKLLYVISGKYENCTKAQLEARFANFDLQANDNMAHKGWDRHYGFEKTFVVNEDGTFVVTYDISSLITSAGAYTSHFEIVETENNAPSDQNKIGDFKPDVDSFEQTVQFNGYNVTIELVKNSDKDYEFWGCVGVIVAAAE